MILGMNTAAYPQTVPGQPGIRPTDTYFQFCTSPLLSSFPIQSVSIFFVSMRLRRWCRISSSHWDDGGAAWSWWCVYTNGSSARICCGFAHWIRTRRLCTHTSRFKLDSQKQYHPPAHRMYPNQVNVE